MIKNIERKLSKRYIILIILLIVALLSNIFVSKIVTAPKFNAETIKSLEEKKATVVKLAAAAAASSTALSLLPGDVATPIANQMAELSKYFIIILSAILLEKMLISVVGYVSFSYIIPFACILGALYLFIKVDGLRKLAIKLAIFGIVIFVAIPASMKVSDLIYSSHQASIEQTLKTAKENKEYIDVKKEELSEEDKGWKEKIGDHLSNLTSKIGNGISEIIEKGEDTFNSFLDAIAVMIITTCVIPLIVILVFIWIIKILFSFDIKIPNDVISRKSKTFENE